jgi:hypothetical protein
MATLAEKNGRLEAARQKVDEFVAAGGDPGSSAAMPVQLEFVYAFADIAKEYGYDILKQIKELGDYIKPDPASHS